MLQKYDDVIKDQLSQGIVEKATEEADGREFYIPHKPVVHDSAETTKLRIVYDASARENEKAPSLNECLELTLECVGEKSTKQQNVLCSSKNPGCSPETR
jgi:hypothetical protein